LLALESASCSQHQARYIAASLYRATLGREGDSAGVRTDLREVEQGHAADVVVRIIALRSTRRECSGTAARLDAGGSGLRVNDSV